MSLIHKQHRTDRLALAVSVGVVAASLVAGCQNKSKSSGPFTDVTDRDRAQSTYAAAAQGEQQPTAPSAAVTQTPPPEVGEAARMQSPRLPDAPATETETARVERDVRSAETANVSMATAQNDGDAVADRTGRPTTQGTNSIVIDSWGGARRTWPRSASLRPSGDVLAGPYYWPMQLTDKYSTEEWHRGWLEPIDFLANTVMLPYRAVVTPPNSKIIYSQTDDSSTSPAISDAATPAEGLPPGARSRIDETGVSVGDQIPAFGRSGSTRGGSGGSGGGGAGGGGAGGGAGGSGGAGGGAGGR